MTTLLLWRQVLCVAAGLSVVAGGIHLVLAPEHYAEWWGYGVFFVVAAAAQIIYAPLVLARPRPMWFATGIAGNVAIIVLYVLTRAVGIPLGPAAGRVEDVAPIDVASKVAEGVLVVTLAYLWARRPSFQVLRRHGSLPA